MLANLDSKLILNKGMVRREFKQLGRRVYERQYENDALPNDNAMANLDSEHVNNNDDDVNMMNLNRVET